ncbi:hypothetical protein QN412_13980 [Pseudomonas sp. RTB3]|uniref:hypothetical protein n=1 Tax=unclassified Pseudomonas TaxID=196821 RepID=UPI002B23C0CC|nr:MULTISPECIES: hypothetical protein [unclassified Pseudomonas]MEB0008357.1 hypothetical protein [Pseudomonas sp. RTB2]MEB0018053.1 hypothetical protein [Pseudomonas sp. RTB3]MEB0270150.1 hypothetical protein [Pseudomonas sp. 5B4]
MDRIKLRNAGEFSNNRAVEYATVKVELPHHWLPSNLKSEHYCDEDIVRGLYPSPGGRLTYKTLYLDSLELAERFAEYLHKRFNNRRYAKDYYLKVEVLTTTQTVTATKARVKHSDLVLAALALNEG